jgi:hypothetical protein
MLVKDQFHYPSVREVVRVSRRSPAGHKPCLATPSRTQNARSA